MYLNANNLHGWAMVQHFPTSGFKWSFTSIEDILKHPVNDKVGYICEVDLEYLDEFHQMHNDYPLAPEKLEVQKEWLSNYQHNLMTKKTSLKVKKLVPNLRNKQKYVVQRVSIKVHH